MPAQMPTSDEGLAGVEGDRHGLEWERDVFSLRTVWTVDPSIQRIRDICFEALQQTYPGVIKKTGIEVEFLDQGAFNRVYSVKATVEVGVSSDAQLKTGLVTITKRFKYVLRVSLPVDPRLKSLSEVATIQYLNERTNIPVSTVLHSSPSADNALGFEWMFQTYVPGYKLSSIWQQLGETGRERMIRQLAAIQAELFKKTRFRQIGNIYQRGHERGPGEYENSSTASGSQPFYVGKIVSNPFILQSAMVDLETVKRGPFRTTADWLSAQLENMISVCKILGESSDKYDLEAADRSGEIAERLLILLPKYFPDSDVEEETCLIHSDLSQQNIFCRADGTITAILDWEATSCLPLWTAYDLPQLIQGKDYPEEPDSKEYNGGADDMLFQGRLLMWQQMKLRSAYQETMAAIWPGWCEEYEKKENLARRDFRRAVEVCDAELAWYWIVEWLDRNEQLQDTDEYFPLVL